MGSLLCKGGVCVWYVDCIYDLFKQCYNWRFVNLPVQEDSHITTLDIGDGQKTALFAIFDGHGGKLVSLYTSLHLVEAIKDSEAFKGGDLGLAFAEAFYKIDEELDSPQGLQELMKLAGVNKGGTKRLFDDVEDIELHADNENETEEKPRAMEKAQSNQFLESALARNSIIPVGDNPDEIAEAMLKKEDSEDDYAEHRATGMGCTAVAAMIRGNDVVIANTGDSRCVISRKGIAEPLTLDHKPVLLEEAERIMKAGGFVRDNRVNGALNVSRTIGDLDFKKNAALPHTHQMVVATPDITTFTLQKGDEFLILACDGIWDVLSNQEAVDFVRKRIKQGQDLKSICEEMCDHCLAPDLKGLCRGADNMSVIVLLFRHTADLGNPWVSTKKALYRWFCKSH